MFASVAAAVGTQVVKHGKEGREEEAAAAVAATVIYQALLQKLKGPKVEGREVGGRGKGGRLGRGKEGGLLARRTDAGWIPRPPLPLLYRSTQTKHNDVVVVQCNLHLHRK